MGQTGELTGEKLSAGPGLWRGLPEAGSMQEVWRDLIGQIFPGGACEPGREGLRVSLGQGVQLWGWRAVTLPLTPREKT